MALCVEPSLCAFSATCGYDIQTECRLNSMTALGFRHSRSTLSLSATSSFQTPSLTKQAFSGASWSMKLRQKGQLGFERKAAERDAASVATSDELVDMNGIVFEEDDEGEGSDDAINGMLRQDRNYLEEDVDNWQMFAAEEGARPNGDYETDAEDESSGNSVRRRKAEEVLLSFPDSNGMNWSAADKEKAQALQVFKHTHESNKGSLLVEAMRPKHMTDIETLLVDSFAELMGGLLTYRPLLAFTVKQYVRERYATLPHSVTLVGLYSPAEGIEIRDTDEAGTDEAGTDESSSENKQDWEEERGDGDSDGSLVAGTVELSFSIAGHPDVPTPAPPPNSPYICNMAIKKQYRRRGLGRQMLKAAEDLALSMGCEDMYLHVRMMDTAPLTMYKEAGYQVVSTDSLLSVLTFQRRRHLMRKRLCRARLVPE